MRCSRNTERDSRRNPIRHTMTQKYSSPATTHHIRPIKCRNQRPTKRVHTSHPRHASRVKASTRPIMSPKKQSQRGLIPPQVKNMSPVRPALMTQPPTNASTLPRRPKTLVPLNAQTNTNPPRLPSRDKVAMKFLSSRIRSSPVLRRAPATAIHLPKRPSRATLATDR